MLTAATVGNQKKPCVIEVEIFATDYYIHNEVVCEQINVKNSAQFVLAVYR